MLSIGKLGAGQQSYYLENVARGIEDYYSGRGEVPGRWVGSGALMLGLDGRVDSKDLGVVLAGRDPRSQAALGRMRSDRVPGFDLTFRAPKSVSVLFGLGDFATSAEVRASHDVAVDAALGYLERAACWSRRGTNGVEEVPGAGFVGAAFRHRSSRAGDPHLHTHVLVANVTAGPDNRWATLDARHLYLHAKTAGYLYEAHLRAELTRRLGIEWRPVRNGIGDLEGISDEVLRAFSTRRAEIEAEMEARGVSSARAAEVVALDTRQAKDYGVASRSLIERWWDQAQELGIDRETVASTLDRTERRQVDDPDVEPVIAALLSADGLTARASTFDRRDVLRAWCDHVTAGANVTQIEALADQTLTQSTVVALEANTATTLRTRGRGRRIAGPDLGRCYCTAELLALEERLIERASDRRGDGVGVVDADVVLNVLAARPELSEEQSAMVVRLTTSGRGVEVVIAAAGTGKTFALDAVRDAWQRQGHRVIGVALAARAAAELEATAGIRSHTIASLLADLERAEPGPWKHGTVLVVDESGMVGTRTLGRLLDHAAYTRAKVVLVGDPRQLPEIGAGGLLRGLGQRLEPIRLTQNRRQHEAWERAGSRHCEPAARRDGRRLVGGESAQRPRAHGRSPLV